ncbi:MAG: SDR family NAD(P)-dependent oxidoreductase [Pseudomonadales bacterium]
MERFTNKVALVTGAASGIGRATAVRLAAEGAAVMLADVNDSGLTKVAEQIREGGATVATACFDATDNAACRQIVQSTVGELGKLDVVCNIAGVAGTFRFAEYPEDAWYRMMDINLNSLFLISQEAIPHLLKTRGNIVNMSSASGKQGQPYNACYCASKAGVIGLTRSIATEFGSAGVRCNAICPGSVNTSIHENFTFPENPDMKLVERMFPLPDTAPAEPEEVAAMVAYLASDEARFITGVDYSIDGGQLAL